MKNEEIMEVNETITPEEVEEIMDALSTKTSRLKTVTKVGVIGAVSITAWEFAVKPLARKVKGLIEKKKAVKKSGKIDEEENDFYDENLSDVPEIDK